MPIQRLFEEVLDSADEDGGRRRTFRGTQRRPSTIAGIMPERDEVTPEPRRRRTLPQGLPVTPPSRPRTIPRVMRQLGVVDAPTIPSRPRPSPMPIAAVPSPAIAPVMRPARLGPQLPEAMPALPPPEVVFRRGRIAGVRITRPPPTAPQVVSMDGVCPPGFHLDKETGTRCVRNRRTNFANPQALARANRRLEGFAGLAKRAQVAIRRAANAIGATPPRRAPRPRVVQESGPGSVQLDGRL